MCCTSVVSGLRLVSLNIIWCGQDTPEPKQFTSADVVKRLEYFGITVSNTNINSILSAVFADSNPEQAKFYKQLKGTKRVQNEFHVTAIHRANATTDPQIWQTYVDLYRETLDTKGMNDRTPSLGNARRHPRSMASNRNAKRMSRRLRQHRLGPSYHPRPTL